jgi:ABC-2 type transport system permease protein
MILSLFLYNIKKNRLMWLSILAVMFFYNLVILMMYDPDNIQALNAMLELFPKEMMQAIGFANFGTSMIEFIVGYIYGFLIYLFPMVLTVIINHRLVASMVDQGSMAYLLSTPHSRRSVIITQAIFSILAMALFFSVMSVVAIISAELLFEGHLDISMYLQVNFYNILQYFALGAIIFFGSSLANESNQSLAVGVGLPVIFLIMQMAANLGGNMEVFKYFTLYTLFNPESLLLGEAFASQSMGVLAVIGIIFYGLSIYVFERKNLYI